eukprot:TRINITY_DN10582_c0_g1_i1.p1 TRINITY_DN10582_c0_g1~~TRINITY_DN10582_c0_g1_i1.p1  ORF type:complete len:1268 (+),score=236.37 TRINITY_DN10582_c0_g1_i1:202-3804(+)
MSEIIHSDNSSNGRSPEENTQQTRPVSTTTSLTRDSSAPNSALADPTLIRQRLINTSPSNSSTSPSLLHPPPEKPKRPSNSALPPRSSSGEKQNVVISSSPVAHRIKDSPRVGENSSLSMSQDDKTRFLDDDEDGEKKKKKKEARFNTLIKKGKSLTMRKNQPIPPPDEDYDNFSVSLQPQPTTNNVDTARSSIVEKLTKVFTSERDKVAFEIYSTEISYINALNLIVQDFITNETPLVEEEMKSVFSNIKIIRQVALELLNRLDEAFSRWGESSTIGDIFIRMAPYLKVYSQYCDNYEHAIECLHSLQTRPNIFAWLEDRRNLHQGATLESLLITPVQRLPRYLLLLHDMIRRTTQPHPDHELLSQAFNDVSAIATKINESVRAHEAKKRFLDYANFARFQKFIAPHRHFLSEVTGTITREGKEFSFFLIFNDSIVFGTRQPQPALDDQLCWETCWLHDETPMSTPTSSVANLTLAPSPNSQPSLDENDGLVDNEESTSLRVLSPLITSDLASSPVSRPLSQHPVLNVKHATVREKKSGTSGVDEAASVSTRMMRASPKRVTTRRDSNLSKFKASGAGGSANTPKEQHQSSTPSSPISLSSSHSSSSFTQHPPVASGSAENGTISTSLSSGSLTATTSAGSLNSSALLSASSTQATSPSSLSLPPNVIKLYSPEYSYIIKLDSTETREAVYDKLTTTMSTYFAGQRGVAAGGVAGGVAPVSSSTTTGVAGPMGVVSVGPPSSFIPPPATQDPHAVNSVRSRRRVGRHTYSDSRIFDGDWVDRHPNGHGLLTFSNGTVITGEWDRGRQIGFGKMWGKGGQITYEGGWKDGLFDGEGTLSMVGYATYTGPWRAGRKHGPNGILKFDSGELYQGQWESDRMAGKCTYRDAAGNCYRGEVVDGQRHGRGVFESKDGARYEGEWIQDKRFGKGTMLYANRDTYDGEWKDDMRDGLGLWISRDGFRYYGGWVRDLREGQGEYRLDRTGLVYNGQWKEGKKHGQGRQTFSDGSVYDGQWAEDKHEGTGKYSFSNGDIYDGNWSADTRHGTGTMTFSEGSRYHGLWVKDRRQGRGTFTSSSGDVYDGDWKDDRRHGTGKYTSPANKSRYDGEWQCDVRQGKGVLVDSTGFFKGNFFNDLRHGSGTLIYPDSSTYTGSWYNGRKNGQGTLSTADGKEEVQIWSHGMPEDAPAMVFPEFPFLRHYDILF